MQIVIDIPDEQVKKSLEESKYILEDEGEKGSVQIVMLHTNARLESVVVERKTDFYSCEYKILPKGHGRLIDADDVEEYLNDIQFELDGWGETDSAIEMAKARKELDSVSTIIEADKAESEG